MIKYDISTFISLKEENYNKYTPIKITAFYIRSNDLSNTGGIVSIPVAQDVRVLSGKS